MAWATAASALPGCRTAADASSAGEDTGSGEAGDTEDTEESGGEMPDLPQDCGSASGWASGGTAAMTSTHCYPDPFVGAVQCPLLCQTTAGPCTAESPERRDISEGLAGLPVRLALKVVDEDCNPIEGAVVHVWHTRAAGIYSGPTPSAACNGGDEDASNGLDFRGRQVTDPDGRVDFDTCFPGWYPGRTNHIHFGVVVGDDIYFVSQLVFDDALNVEVFTSHPDYEERGPADTSNETDGVFAGLELADYRLDVAQMPDGAMLASKVISVRDGFTGC